jgi:general secretion pathway protein E
MGSERTKPRELAQIAPEQLSAELMRRLPLEFLKKQRAIPILLEPNEPAVALADPLNLPAYDAIVSILGRPCRRIVCPASEIEQAISRCYYLSPGEEGNYLSPADPAAPSSPEADLAAVSSTVQTRAEDLLSIADKAPAIKLVNKILFHALHSRASDIHIEPYEQQVQIRFRVDGVLRPILTLPKAQVAPLLSRLKIMANLNIAEHRLSQDGQSRVSIGQELVDIRVSVIPTAGGERVVLRLLDKGRGELTLEEVGFGPDLLKTFRRLIGVSHGIILITGPTGSGKTTTLYAALNELNGPERNILTVEDPVEYQMAGIGQMQVRPKIDLTFANCLRHILRQDPDIIMIGEIRDRETAEIAIQASLTGHLVLSTLHTNDAASAVTRLTDMGIEPYLISSTVVGVMAQRLVRVICPDCKEPYEPQPGTVSWSELQQVAQSGCDRWHRHPADAAWAGSPCHEEAASPTPSPGFVKLYQGRGCEKCLQTGYLGRTGIFELLLVDDRIRQMIVGRQEAHLIKQAAVEKGMATLRQDGLRLALAGRTTLPEVYRVTQDSVPIAQEASSHVRA